MDKTYAYKMFEKAENSAKGCNNAQLDALLAIAAAVLFVGERLLEVGQQLHEIDTTLVQK